MLNDSTDIKKSSEGKKPIRKLYVALGVIGAAIGFAVATFFAFVKPLPESITADYSSTIEFKASEDATSDPQAQIVVSETSATGDSSIEVLSETEASVSQVRENCEPPELEDPEMFAVELVRCEFTIFKISDSGKPVAIDPSEEARQIIENQSSVVSVAPAPAKKPSSSSSGSQSTGSGSSSATPTPEQNAPAPAPIAPPAPVSNICPQNRGENPAVYDACRAGFAAPSAIEFTGDVSCRVRSEGEYEVTIGLRIVGGSYKGVSWNNARGSGSSGSLTFTVFTSPENLSHDQLLAIYDVALAFESMDSRYQGVIDYIYYNGQATGNLNSCR